MKILKISLLALSLLAALPLQAAERRRAGRHRSASGAGCIAVIRNLGSDDNTTQFLAGAIQATQAGLKVDTFLSNGDDARFRDFVTVLSARNMTASFFRRGEPPIPPSGLAHRGGRHAVAARYRRQRQRSPASPSQQDRRFAGQRLLRPAGEGFQRPCQHHQPGSRLPADGTPPPPISSC